MAKRKKKNEPVFKRLSENAKAEKFTAMGQLVQQGKAVYAYYAIDGNVGYHHYRMVDK